MNLHSESQALFSRAEEALHRGNREEAYALYHQAAELEESAVANLQENAVRTRGVLSISAVALYYRARALDRAQNLALKLLASNSLPSFAEDEIRETLKVIWEEQTLELSGQRFSPDTILVSLRGQAIGSGRAPLSLVVDKIQGIHSLLYRVTEWLGGFPFRTRGGPPEEVRDLWQAWVSEPQAGSYRFSIQLVEPAQLELIPSRRVYSPDITRSVLEILKSLSVPAGPIAKALNDIVPDRPYRDAILKLVRNLAPDGQRVREIEFSNTSLSQETNSVLLLANTRDTIRDALTPSGEGQSEQFTGILRAVHLDKGWIEVTEESGLVRHCSIGHDVLDDVIGPMLNHPVLVTGWWTPKRGQYKVSDIELAAD